MQNALYLKENNSQTPNTDKAISFSSSKENQGLNKELKESLKANPKLKNGFALVTGASGGIGFELALELAKQGYHLLLIARRQEGLEQCALMAAKFKVKTQIHSIDLMHENALESLKNIIAALDHPLMVLVNNAGIGFFGRFDQRSLSEHTKTLKLNALIPMELIHLCLPYLKQSPGIKYILNVGSIAAYQPIRQYSVYGATKAYLNYLSASLHSELKKDNIYVSCLNPGGTYTDFFKHSDQEINATGLKSMMSAKKVAQIAVKGLLSKKIGIVPGFTNQITAILPSFLPRRLALWLYSLVFEFVSQRKEKN